MTRVKICGVRSPEEALAAADAGADFVGIVFVPERHRRIAPETGRDIREALGTAGAAPQLVGLFADQPLDEVNRIVEECQLDAAQLCGAETADYASGVVCQAIKVVHVAGSADAGDAPDFAGLVEQFRLAGHMVTLDRLVEGIQGGTGQGFDWEVAAALAGQGHSFLLAGGLTPENVGQAIAAVKPWGVDVSSGVESDGRKDAQKVRQFVVSVRRADGAD